MLQADKEVKVQIRIQRAPNLEHTLLSPELKEQVVTTLAIQTVVYSVENVISEVEVLCVVARFVSCQSFSGHTAV